MILRGGVSPRVRVRDANGQVGDRGWMMIKVTIETEYEHVKAACMRTFEGQPTWDELGFAIALAVEGIAGTLCGQPEDVLSAMEDSFRSIPGGEVETESRGSGKA